MTRSISMDFFISNVQNIINCKDFNNPANATILRLKNTIAAVNALRYEGTAKTLLPFLAGNLQELGFTGEAYKALRSMPDGGSSDKTGLISFLNSRQPMPRSLQVSLEIVSYCNIRCPLCSNAKQSGKEYYQHGRVMPFETFKKIYDDIKPYTGLLILVGQGETFLHPDIYKMLEYVKPTPVHIDTNANVKLDTKRIIDSSMASLLFSVDGVDQRTYVKYRVGGDINKCFDNINAMVAAKREARRGPRLVWKYVVFKHNEAYLGQAESMARAIGVDSFQVVPCQVTPQNTVELIKEFMPVGLSPDESIIKFVDFENNMLGLNYTSDSPYCKAPLHNPHIRVNGDINVCCSSYDPIGNVAKDGFLKIWGGDNYLRLRKEILADRFSYVPCRSCSRQQLTLGHVFDGTVMEAPKPPEASPNGTMWMKDLKIEPEYLDYLHENGLTKDLEYYKARKVITAEQAAPRAFQLGPVPAGIQEAVSLT
jgi:MoaA/NifB/PqqE/SkfB family radical SAM enzyme